MSGNCAQWWLCEAWCYHVDTVRHEAVAEWKERQQNQDRLCIVDQWHCRQREPEGTAARHRWRPNHNSSSSKRYDLSDTACSCAFISTTVGTLPSACCVQGESAFVRDHYTNTVTNQPPVFVADVQHSEVIQCKICKLRFPFSCIYRLTICLLTIWSNAFAAVAKLSCSDVSVFTWRSYFRSSCSSLLQRLYMAWTFFRVPV